MVREVLSKLPKNVLANIEIYGKEYKGLPYLRDETRARMAGYAEGLRDGGLITERERQVIFVYMTV